MRAASVIGRRLGSALRLALGEDHLVEMRLDHRRQLFRLAEQLGLRLAVLEHRLEALATAPLGAGSSFSGVSLASAGGSHAGSTCQSAHRCGHALSAADLHPRALPTLGSRRRQRPPRVEAYQAAPIARSPRASRLEVRRATR